MRPNAETETLARFKNPAVRHLAWLCQAPQLLHTDIGFSPARWLPGDYIECLQHWDENPGAMPDRLLEKPERRLGHYFERLYEVLLVNLLGWEILLKNQPVRRQGITLGELDFVVRNTADDMIEHHEIAVKFYLGYPGGHRDTALWYGPNASDRLDLKTAHLVNSQSQLTQRPETQSLFELLDVPPPNHQRIFMPGYLFYPRDSDLPAPEGVPEDHLRGRWIYLDSLNPSTQDPSERIDIEHWVPLNKPHWLGPWHQPAEPNPFDTQSALDQVRSAGVPRLFAELTQNEVGGRWGEQSRWFVMPRGWPLPHRTQPDSGHFPCSGKEPGPPD
ncbi:MAG TPA: DUF1853 family protein [Marinobacter sp.]|nr:DUF1853 family protein [Marinobacter sp.]